MSCASDPAPQPTEETAEVSATDDSSTTNLGMKIETAPEGLLFTFDSIPEDATTLFINLYEGEQDNKQWSDIFGIVVGPKLEEVRNTKRLLCPFTKMDQPYAVSAQFVRNDEIVSAGDVIELTPTQNVVSLVNELTLDLNEDQTGVTLSAEPEFSAPVEYLSRKYDYVLLNFLDENQSISSEIYSGDELSCTFIPDTINLIKEHNSELSGDYPSHVVALCNLNYQGVFWKVLVAKTEDFTVSF
jgi:hypothetical protein